MTRPTGIFTINGEKKTYHLFQEGDRVAPIPKDTTAIGAKGTVQKTSDGGLFVDVRWDDTLFPSIMGGTVQLGSRRLINSIHLLEQEA